MSRKRTRSKAGSLPHVLAHSLFLSLIQGLDSSESWVFFLRLSPLLVSQCRHGCSSSSTSRPCRGRSSRQVRAHSRSRHLFLWCNHVFFKAYLLSSYSCRLFFCSRASIVTSFFRSKHGNHFHPVSFCFLKFSSAVSREEYICCEFVFMIFLLFDRFVVLGLKHEKVSPFVQSFLVFQFPYCVLLLVMVQPDVDLCNLKHLYLTLIPVFLSLPNYDTEWKIFALLLHWVIRHQALRLSVDGNVFALLLLMKFELIFFPIHFGYWFWGIRFFLPLSPTLAQCFLFFFNFIFKVAFLALINLFQTRTWKFFASSSLSLNFLKCSW